MVAAAVVVVGAAVVVHLEHSVTEHFRHYRPQVDKHHPQTWVAIDDLDLNAGEPRMRGHFLKCNPLIGLTNDLVEHGVAVLNGGR